MRLFICTNSSSERHRAAARAVIAKITEGCRADFCMPGDDCANLYDGSREYAGEADSCDYVIGIGGDGTVLRAAQYALSVDKPLLGINNGRLGYLCGAGMADAERFDENTFANMPGTVRTLLEFSIDGNTYTALNDVVVTKTNMGVSVELEAYCRDEFLASWRCDGVIIATPTGSTAYNFSAGGPKIMNDVPCFAVTPICPHNQSTKSVVVNDSSPITVNITERTNKTGYIYADGVLCGQIDTSVTVRKSEKKLVLLGRDPNWI